MTHEVLIVTRWVRYGHDRLYVKAADGTEYGYRDNKTGVSHVAADADAGAFEAALAAYWAGGGKPAPKVANDTAGSDTAGSDTAGSDTAASDTVGSDTADGPLAGRAAATSAPDSAPPAQAPPAPAPAPAPAAPEPPWTDLSLVRPGAAARDQALAKRAEAPVKSLLARVLGVHTEERAWRVGADGEELVAAQLQRLGPAWKTLHAVPVGRRGSDIDHVVIGPGGVYTINTKNHPDASVWVGGDTVMVNGSKTWYVRNSRHEARRAADLLTARAGFPVYVTGLVAVICDRTKFTVKNQPPGGDVHVLARRKVADWLSRRGPVLTAEQVETVFEIARRSTTWTG